MQSSNLQQDLMQSLQLATQDIANISYLEQIFDLLPVSIYWKDRDGRYLGLNRFAAQTMHRQGYSVNNKNDIKHRTDFDLFDTNTASQFRENDLQTMSNDYNDSSSFLEIANNGSSHNLYQQSIKLPLRNNANETLGIIGCTIDISDLHIEKETSLQQKFALLMGSQHQTLAALDAFTIEVQEAITKINTRQLWSSLSRRELQCFLLIARGYTAKEIGKLFNISHRTAEEFISRLKYKLSCTRRSTLIDKFWQMLSTL